MPGTRDADGGRIAKLAVVETKRPEMPRADHAPRFKRAPRQIPAGVWAGIVEHVNFFLAEINRKDQPADFDIFAFAFAKLDCVGREWSRPSEEGGLWKGIRVTPRWRRFLPGREAELESIPARSARTFDIC